MTGGGTDAGQFHLYGKGVPSIVIGVAARYIHSHVSMISKSDLDHAVRLLVEVVKGLNHDRYNEFIQYV
jgi:endoglucanase